VKTKKLVQKALSNPELYSLDELTYFQMWLRQKEAKKAKKQESIRLKLEQAYLQ
jgi:hypothetical protein